MKYTEAWGSIASQNTIFKVLTFILIGVVGILSVGVLSMSLKDSIVIERSNVSRLMNAADNARTKEEIQSFIAEALDQRFSSNKENESFFLSLDQQKLKQVEQKQLNDKKMIQRVLFNSLRSVENGYQVDMDRVISVGDVRVAFKFPVHVQVDTNSRSAFNPYGLVLVEAEPIEKESAEQSKSQKEKEK